MSEALLLMCGSTLLGLGTMAWRMHEAAKAAVEELDAMASGDACALAAATGLLCSSAPFQCSLRLYDPEISCCATQLDVDAYVLEFSPVLARGGGGKVEKRKQRVARTPRLVHGHWHLALPDGGASVALDAASLLPLLPMCPLGECRSSSTHPQLWKQFGHDCTIRLRGLLHGARLTVVGARDADGRLGASPRFTYVGALSVEELHRHMQQRQRAARTAAFACFAGGCSGLGLGLWLLLAAATR